MHKRVSVTILIPAYNEEANIELCLKSVHEWANEIIIVDSLSTDRTVEICSLYTDKIVLHPYAGNHGKQVNWALESLDISSDWVFQLDADEIVTPELAEEICQSLPGLPSDVTGVYLKRRYYFLGRWMKHGELGAMWALRLTKRGCSRYEDFEEDHVLLQRGRAVRFKQDFIDYNHKGLSFWTDKHNGWASNEARDTVIQMRHSELPMSSIRPAFFGPQDQRRRWLKTNVYVRTPLFLRAFLYFGYRYFLRLGFLDGSEGLIFHFLQCLWYRFYVDAKIWETRYLASQVTKDDSPRDPKP